MNDNEQERQLVDCAFSIFKNQNQKPNQNNRNQLEYVEINAQSNQSVQKKN